MSGLPRCVSHSIECEFFCKDDESILCKDCLKQHERHHLVWFAQAVKDFYGDLMHLINSGISNVQKLIDLDNEQLQQLIAAQLKIHEHMNKLKEFHKMNFKLIAAQYKAPARNMLIHARKVKGDILGELSHIQQARDQKVDVVHAYEHKLQIALQAHERKDLHGILMYIRELKEHQSDGNIECVLPHPEVLHEAQQLLDTPVQTVQTTYAVPYRSKVEHETQTDAGEPLVLPANSDEARLEGQLLLKIRNQVNDEHAKFVHLRNQVAAETTHLAQLRTEINETSARMKSTQAVAEEERVRQENARQESVRLEGEVRELMAKLKEKCRQLKVVDEELEQAKSQLLHDSPRAAQGERSYKSKESMVATNTTWLYSITGNKPIVRVFDCQTERALPSKSLPSPLPEEFDSVLIEGNIFICGGRRKTGEFVSEALLYEYKEDISDLTLLANMKWGRWKHTLVNKFNSYIYCIGGEARTYCRICEKYNVDIGNWEVLPLLNANRILPAACLLAERYLYVFGGTFKDSLASSIEYLDTNNDYIYDCYSLCVLFCLGSTL